MKVKTLIGAGIILMTLLLALSSLALIVIFEDDDYMNMYLNVVGAYAKNPGDPAVKNELLDVVEYYIQHEDVNSDLLDTGSRSGEQIITILDKYGAPCSCLPGGQCDIPGDNCCCAGKLYQCGMVGGILSWQYSGDCIGGCCESACCGGVVTTRTTSTTTSSSTTTTLPGYGTICTDCCLVGSTSCAVSCQEGNQDIAAATYISSCQYDGFNLYLEVGGAQITKSCTSGKCL